MKRIALLQATTLYSVAAVCTLLAPEGTTIEAARARAVPFVEIGSEFGTVRVKSSAGEHDWSPPAGRLSLLLHFNPGCQGCSLVTDAWHELIDLQQAMVFNDIPLDVYFTTQTVYEPSLEYLAEYGFEGELFEFLLERDEDGEWPREARRFFSTPQTILIDSEGHVAKNQTGAWEAQEILPWIERIDEAVALIGAAGCEGHDH